MNNRANNSNENKNDNESKQEKMEENEFEIPESTKDTKHAVSTIDLDSIMIGIEEYLNDDDKAIVGDKVNVNVVKTEPSESEEKGPNFIDLSTADEEAMQKEQDEVLECKEQNADQADEDKAEVGQVNAEAIVEDEADEDKAEEGQANAIVEDEDKPEQAQAKAEAIVEDEADEDKAEEDQDKAIVEDEADEVDEDKAEQGQAKTIMKDDQAKETLQDQADTGEATTLKEPPSDAEPTRSILDDDTEEILRKLEMMDDSDLAQMLSSLQGEKKPVTSDQQNVIKQSEIRAYNEKQPVYIYTSLAGGGFHMVPRTNRLTTILTANRIKYQYRDLGTDEEARKVWRSFSKGKTLPGIVRGRNDFIGNWEDIDEANEDYRLRELIYDSI